MGEFGIIVFDFSRCNGNFVKEIAYTIVRFFFGDHDALFDMFHARLSIDFIHENLYVKIGKENKTDCTM